MPRLRPRLAVLALALLGAGGLIHAHCEIPCGIYGDRTRIDLLREDVATIEKSMQSIQELAGQQDAQSLNQLNRWIANKDEHAGRVQEIVTQYFMTQRVKPAAGDGRERYLAQLGALHEMLQAAMKCKQTVDPVHCERLRQLIGEFAKAYFSPEDLEHLKEHEAGGGR